MNHGKHQVMEASAIRRTTWRVQDGSIVVTLPDATEYEHASTLLEHPYTVCAVVDVFLRLSRYERQAVVSILLSLLR